MVALVHACYLVGVVLLPFPRLSHWAGFGSRFQLADLAFATALLSGGLAAMTGRLRVSWNGSHIALLGYLGAAALSLVATPDVRTAAIKLVGVLYLALLFLLTHTLFREVHAFNRIARAWAVGGSLAVLTCLAGIVLFFGGHTDPHSNPFIYAGPSGVPQTGYPRVMGLFDQPSKLCNYLIVALSMVGAASAQAREKTGFVLIAGGIAVMTVFSMTTAIGGLTLGLAVWWISRRRWSGRRNRPMEYAVLSAGLIATLGLFLLTTVFRLSPAGKGDLSLGVVDVTFAYSGRVALWQSAFRTFREHPWTGRGLNIPVAPTANVQALWGASLTKSAEKVHPREAHNTWLSVLGQMGIPGFLAFSAFIALVCRRAWPRAGSPSAQREIQMALGCGMFAAFFYGAFFEAFDDLRHLWMLFGMIVAAKELGSSARRSEVSSQIRSSPEGTAALVS